MEGVKDGDGQSRQTRDEHAILLLRRLFHAHYCPENNVPQPDKPGVPLVLFCGWCDAHMSLMDPQLECDAAGVGLETWQFVRRLLDGGAAPEALASVRYAITLGDRPPPKVNIKRVVVAVVTTFEDGTISADTAHMSVEMCNGRTVTDADFGTFITHNATNLVEKVVAAGLDRLHAESQEHVYTADDPTDPYDVAMGCIMQNIPRLKPVLQAPVKTYARLFQTLVRPPLPPEAMNRARTRAMVKDGERTGNFTGGWDV